MKRQFAFAFVVCGIFMVMPARATLVNENWKTPGDNLLTLDTTTGLTWLNLTVTLDLTYNAVAAQLGPGGTYNGFAIANTSQIDTLGADAGITERSGQYDTTNLTTITNFISLIGATYNQEGVVEAVGFDTDIFSGQHRDPFFEYYGGAAQASVFAAGTAADPQTYAEFGSSAPRRACPNPRHWLF